MPCIKQMLCFWLFYFYFCFYIHCTLPILWLLLLCVIYPSIYRALAWFDLHHSLLLFSLSFLSSHAVAFLFLFSAYWWSCTQMDHVLSYSYSYFSAVRFTWLILLSIILWMPTMDAADFSFIIRWELAKRCTLQSFVPSASPSSQTHICIQSEYLLPFCSSSWDLLCFVLYRKLQYFSLFLA